MERPITAIVVDSTPSGQTHGHFVSTLRYLTHALASVSTDVRLLITRDTAKAIELDRVGSEVDWPLTTEQIAEYDGGFSSAMQQARDFFHIRSEGKNGTVVVFPWMDFINFEELRDWDDWLASWNIPWLTIGKASASIRMPDSRLAQGERESLNRLFGLKSAGAVFYWDFREATSLEHLRQYNLVNLPEFHEGLYDTDPAACLEMPGWDRGDFRLGFFGRISGKRGFATFLRLGLLNPRVTFVIRGAGYPHRECLWPEAEIERFPRIGRSLAFGISRLYWSLVRRIPNLDYEEAVYDSQYRLNQELSDVHAVYVDGSRSPYSSGIALQALACGTPVLWTLGRSSISDYLQKYVPGGRIKRWMTWTPGGLARPRESSNEIQRTGRTYTLASMTETVRVTVSDLLSSDNSQDR